MGWLTGKLIGFAVGGLVLAGGSLWLYKTVQNHFISVDNLHVQLSNETNRANRAEVSLGALEQTLELRDAHTKEVTRIRAESQSVIDTIRTKARADMEVMEDRDRLSRRVIANPEAVQRLYNNATR